MNYNPSLPEESTTPITPTNKDMQQFYIAALGMIVALAMLIFALYISRRTP